MRRSAMLNTSFNVGKNFTFKQINGITGPLMVFYPAYLSGENCRQIQFCGFVPKVKEDRLG
jgi:hypothetical protein